MKTVTELARDWFLLEDINLIGIDQLEGFVNAAIAQYREGLLA